MESSNLNKPKNFTNNPFFRLVAPFILSILVYFLVLLLFDTIDQFETNFFRAELILCLVIGYLVSETNRFLIIILEKKLPEKISLSRRILLQVASSSLLIVLVTSLAVSFYMKNLVGFKSYNSELIVFNSLYVVLGWCLHAVYFSLVYLKKVADIQYTNEKSIRRAIEIKMESSLNELKPKFLNKCLETLIILGYNNPDIADDYLGKVSDFYRGKLCNKNELVKLSTEIENIENFIAIHTHWFDISMKYRKGFDSNNSEILIMQSTIRIVIEYILKIAILLPKVPLEIFLDINDESFVVSCKINRRLNQEENAYNELDKLNKSYSFYTEKKIETVTTNGLFSAKIPLLVEK